MLVPLLNNSVTVRAIGVAAVNPCRSPSKSIAAVLDPNRCVEFSRILCALTNAARGDRTVVKIHEGVHAIVAEAGHRVKAFSWHIRFKRKQRTSMRIMKIIGLTFAVVLAVAVAALAIDLPNSKGEVKLVRIIAGGRVVAEVKILEPGSINIDPQTVSIMKDPNGGSTYVCSGGVKLKFSTDGKTTFTLSADRIQVENAKPDSSK